MRTIIASQRSQLRHSPPSWKLRVHILIYVYISVYTYIYIYTLRLILLVLSWYSSRVSLTPKDRATNTRVGRMEHDFALDRRRPVVRDLHRLEPPGRRRGGVPPKNSLVPVPRRELTSTEDIQMYEYDTTTTRITTPTALRVPPLRPVARPQSGAEACRPAADRAPDARKYFFHFFLSIFFVTFLFSFVSFFLRCYCVRFLPQVSLHAIYDRQTR